MASDRKRWSTVAPLTLRREQTLEGFYLRPGPLDRGKGMKVLFIGSIGIIARDPSAGRRFFVSALGLPLRRAKGSDFLFSRRLGGSRYFGIWSLTEAARVCFGRKKWPADRPTPQVFLEFEVASAASVGRAATELRSRGIALLHPPRIDPWGQTVARLQTDDGVVIGISYVPWMHPRPRRRMRPSPVPRR